MTQTEMQTDNQLTKAIVDFWAYKNPNAGTITTSGLSQFYGGASRDTYRLTVREGQSGKSHDIVLRLMPEGCLLSEGVSSVATEFYAMSALKQTDLPIPKAYYLENDPKWLGHPFLIVEEIKGCEASASKLAVLPYSSHAQKIGIQFYEALGTLARQNPDTLGLSDRLGVADRENCGATALEAWQTEAARQDLSPLPIYEAGVRWLRNHTPPKPEKLSVVHGDFRAGNFLYREDGALTSILDWELCHIGDPIEDLAWSMMPAWSGGSNAVGRMLDRQDAIAIWEKTSGLHANPIALRWWEIFSNVKLAIALANGGVEYRDGTNSNPQLVVAAWHTFNVAQRTLASLLSIQNSTPSTRKNK